MSARLTLQPRRQGEFLQPHLYRIDRFLTSPDCDRRETDKDEGKDVSPPSPVWCDLRIGVGIGIEQIEIEIGIGIEIGIEIDGALDSA